MSALAAHEAKHPVAGFHVPREANAEDVELGAVEVAIVDLVAALGVHIIASAIAAEFFLAGQ